MVRSWAPLAILLAVIGWGTASADEPVPVYTNADLERLAGPRGTDLPATIPGPDPSEQWQFVQAFLEREFRRLETLRRLELEQAALEIRRRAPEARPGGYLVFAPLAGRLARRGVDHRVADRSRRPTSSGHRIHDPRAFMSHRDAIHARPPLAHHGGARR